MASALEILRQVYGHDAFRSIQADAIETAIEGCDVIALAGTGVGKSFIYQIPMLARDGVGIVVSPLKALMRDQLNTLASLGIAADTINGDVKGYDRQNVMEQVRRGKIKLLYVTPEMLAQASFQTFLKDVKIAAFGIDEAHCASVYGNDFRPDYKMLGMLPVLFPKVPRIAVTATADPDTLDDMCAVLNMQDATVFRGEMDRKNIALSISLRQPAKKHRETRKAILDKHAGESGLIYVMGRKSVDKLVDELIAEGYNALPYHAGMDMMDRELNQESFISGQTDILVCTVAFGMGIDKADIRYIVHEDLSSNIESYVQETGRAGRDGQPASAYMFYSNQDIELRQRMIRKSAGGAVTKRTEKAKVDMLLGLCETKTCRRGAILRYFGQEVISSCDNCDNCLSQAEAVDLTAEAIEIAQFINCAVGRVASDDVITGTSLGGVKASSVLRQLVAAGYVEIDHAAYGAVSLTAAGRGLLAGHKFFGNGSFALTSGTAKAKAKPKSKTRTSKTASAVTPKKATGEYQVPRARKTRSPKGSPLLEALRKMRNTIAREQGVKKFYVIHDAALKQMAEDMPRSIPELLAIKGVGQKKAESYGVTFLNVIRQHAA